MKESGSILGWPSELGESQSSQRLAYLSVPMKPQFRRREKWGTHTKPSGRWRNTLRQFWPLAGAPAPRTRNWHRPRRKCAKTVANSAKEFSVAANFRPKKGARRLPDPVALTAAYFASSKRFDDTHP